MRGEYALGFFLDIAGAFNNLQLTSAVAGMRKANFPPNIRRWFEYYLYNQEATAELKNCKSTAFLHRGTPQGGVMSPLIWNLPFDGLIEIYDNSPVHCIGFADDGSLMICGKDPHVLVTLMQRAINQANEWGQRNGLSFAPAKTVAVIFSKKRASKNTFPPLFLSGVEIHYERSVKYLGLSLIHI